MPPRKKPTAKDTPKAHRFSKVIVREGNYKTYDRSTNKYSLKNVSGEDLDKTVETFSALKEKGFKVPAPWKHDFDINTFTPVEEGNSGILEDSTKNAGFWDNLKVQVGEDGKKELIGEIEAYGDPDDINTPAGKIGKTVKDTSIYLRKEYELTDDSGEKFQNVPMHIALVTHPIELKQKNFESLPSDDTYIAMSDLVSDTDYTELSRMLKDVAGIFLPSNTTPETLVGNLFIALSQLKILKTESESQDDGKSVSPSQLEPIVMANFSKEQIEALVATKAVNPATKKPFTEKDFEETVAPDASANRKSELLMSSMQSLIQDERRRGYRSRINSLVESKRITKAYADEKLYPRAENYTFDPEKEDPFDALVMSLEELPEPPKPDTSDELLMDIGSLKDDASELSDEEMDKIADAMMNDMAEF